jgi:hypothetical protein
VVEQSFRLRRSDLLFFIPALVYTLCFLPYYFLPAAEKLAIVTDLFSDRTLIAREPDVHLPQGLGVAARLIYGMILLTAQFVLLARQRKSSVGNKVLVHQNQSIFRWLLLFTIVLSIFYVLLVLQYLTTISRWYNLTAFINLTFTATIRFISFYLLAKPSILYGITGWIKPTEKPEPEPEIMNATIQTDSKKNSLTPEQGMAYKILLEDHLANHHPFCEGGYTINDLSSELKIPSYQLSTFINQQYGKKF